MAEMGVKGPVETRFSYDSWCPLSSALCVLPDDVLCQFQHLAQSVQHVVVDCVIHKAPEGFAGLRRQDAATRTWLKELNIDIGMTCK